MGNQVCPVAQAIQIYYLQSSRHMLMNVGRVPSTAVSEITSNEGLISHKQ